jgi:DNA-directed RNA polymerase subunit K/omega
MEEPQDYIELENTIIVFEKEKGDVSMTKDYKIANNEKKRITNRQIRNILSPFEKTRIVCERAEQLRRGAPPKVDTSDLIFKHVREKYENIAEEELKQRKLNLIIRRYDHNGCFEDWNVSELGY